MLSVFKRMAAGVLAVMGEDSFLRGSIPCKVNIEHGVQTYGDDGQVIVERSVASIDRALAPKVGDLLLHPDGSFKLDAQFQDNGVLPRFILIKHVLPDPEPVPNALLVDGVPITAGGVAITVTVDEPEVIV